MRKVFLAVFAVYAQLGSAAALSLDQVSAALAGAGSLVSTRAEELAILAADCAGHADFSAGSSNESVFYCRGTRTAKSLALVTAAMADEFSDLSSVLLGTAQITEMRDGAVLPGFSGELRTVALADPIAAATKLRLVSCLEADDGSLSECAVELSAD